MISFRQSSNKRILDIIGQTQEASVRHLKDAIEDIADKIEEEAREQAPVDSGELQAHPVDRDEGRFGTVTNVPLFGGGFAIRGLSGFIPGRGETPGELVAEIKLSVPEDPPQAIFVHGTGLYGPTRAVITAKRPGGRMVFEIDGKIFKRRTVRGQRANPYFERAFDIINSTYVPRRLARLRRQVNN